MTSKEPKEKVIVGLSGGVDSAAAAILLADKYEVIAVTMQLFDDFDSRDAVAVANALDIRHIVVDKRRDFISITNDFIDEYTKGRTPNPCVRCNESIKWQTMIDIATAEGAKYVATGHYASIIETKEGRLAIEMASDKDQSYMLYRLSQEMLSKTLFPLGKWNKDNVRLLVKNHGISIYKKPDSQEICFIPHDDYIAFLESTNHFPDLSGNMIDLHGNILGKHQGIHRFTIGQRKGIGLAFGKRVYVVDINPQTNEVVLGDNEDLYSQGLWIEKLHFSGIRDIIDGSALQVKIRYNHPAVPCTVYREKNGLKAYFDTPERGVTKGQSAVFYEDESVQMGGIIEGALMD